MSLSPCGVGGRQAEGLAGDGWLQHVGHSQEVYLYVTLSKKRLLICYPQ